MSAPAVSLGIIGAGTSFCARHLPNLRELGARLQAVCNSTEESSRSIASRFGIADHVADWREVVERSDVEAVMIGTPPHLQSEIVCAALQAGKHVFCESPLGLNLTQARHLADIAEASPHLVSVVSQSSRRRIGDVYVKRIIESGLLGEITAVDVLNTSTIGWKMPKRDWRAQLERCGRLVLNIDSYAQVLNNWVGPYASLMAVGSRPHRGDSGDIPQIVMISGRLKNGALGVEYHGSLSPDVSTPRDLVTIYGLRGVLRYYFDTGELRVAKEGGELLTVNIPAGEQDSWRSEIDFMDAVTNAEQSGKWEPKANLRFSEAVEVMRKLEAVHHSNLRNQYIDLSLLE